MSFGLVGLFWTSFIIRSCWQKFFKFRTLSSPKHCCTYTHKKYINQYKYIKYFVVRCVHLEIRCYRSYLYGQISLFGPSNENWWALVPVKVLHLCYWLHCFLVDLFLQKLHYQRGQDFWSLTYGEYNINTSIPREI